MNIIKTLLTPATLLVALSLTALPAAAQGRENRGRAGRETGRVAAREATPRQSGAREATPRQSGAREATSRQSGAREATPGQSGAREATPRQNGVREATPGQNGSREANRSQAGARNAGPRDYGRREVAPRQSAPQRNYAPRYEPRRDMGRAYVAPRGNYGSYYRGFAPYRPQFFGRSYYSFRPRLSIGFGLWLGFAVPYPRAWISYPPPVYGYYQGSVRIVPGAAAYGGVSFDISPAEAEVYLDGEFIGRAGDFAPNAAPLTLTPGPHRIEVQAEGYRPMTWDVDVIPGQVIPFRGDMQPF
jgi:hypothetical protein